MSLKHIADHLASKGRGDDSVLIHMTPGEVGGLQALAMAHGGSLTVNPETGLPEAGFLKNILPTLVGLGANLIAPGLGPAATLALGAGTGAILNRGNPLMGALMGGVGAYGGMGLAGGINAAGTAAAAAAETALPTAVTSGVQPGVGTLEMVSPEWVGQAAPAVTTPPVIPPPVTPMTQVPPVVGVNPVISPTGVPIVPPNPVASQGYPIGEIGQGLEPGVGMRPWNAEELARQAAPVPVAAPMTPFQKIGAAFEQPEAFMKGAGGASGLIKYGTAAATPILLGPSDEEEKKPWWATAELPEYRYERGYTGGTRLPGSAETSERRYFDPRFVRMAEGGSVEDQLASARRIGRGFGAAVNIANDATRSFLAGNQAAIPGIIQSNMSRALAAAPAAPQAGIAALQPQFNPPAQPLYMPQAPQAQMFQMPQMQQGAGPGLQTGVRAIDLLSAMPAPTTAVPRYSNPYVGPMTGASASAARYLSGQQSGSMPGAVSLAPAPTYTAPAPTYTAPAPTARVPAPTYTAPAPTPVAPPTFAAPPTPVAPPTEFIMDRGDRATTMPVNPPQPASQPAPAPSGGLTSLMPVYGAPTFAPSAPAYESPAPISAAPAPVFGAPTYAPAPEDRVRIPPPVPAPEAPLLERDSFIQLPRVTPGPSVDVPPAPAPTDRIMDRGDRMTTMPVPPQAPPPAESAPEPVFTAPPPPLTLDDMIRIDAPVAQQKNLDANLSHIQRMWDSGQWSRERFGQGQELATFEYLKNNPDVLAAAMQSGRDLSDYATWHYLYHGQSENRSGSGLMDYMLRQENDTGGGNAAGGHLKSGGFVVPADVVSALGNGSTDAGLEVLMRKYNAKPIDGPGDGMSDSIPTTIEGRQKARVARGEAYIRPEDVQRAGGSKQLYSMLDRIRKNAHGKTTQQRKVNPAKVA